ncbi:Protein PBDC1 [Portunus trituberculatus]|uniref:Protein PBDC1 n=1 Tax=Portunus trituberculatus TaxID=210409 RepID=A0A5B7EXV7_PORTR|nr:Protein PBDC1 [Portunus trituberculatus]
MQDEDTGGQSVSPFHNMVEEEAVSLNQESYLASLSSPLPKWRPFCMKFEKEIEDYSFATLVRIDCQDEYTEPNTILVTRIQFFCIEIARNREEFISYFPCLLFLLRLIIIIIIIIIIVIVIVVVIVVVIIVTIITTTSTSRLRGGVHQAAQGRGSAAHSPRVVTGSTPDKDAGLGIPPAAT